LDAPEKIETLTKQCKGDLSDAERYLELSSLYDEIKSQELSDQAADKAVGLFRKRVDLQPNDTQLSVNFARALLAANKTNEAEVILRKAVRLEPKQWRPKVALGNFLFDQSKRVLAARLPEGRSESRELIFDPQYRPTAEQMRQFKQLITEAEGLLDEAVAVAPSEPRVYLERSAHKSLRSTEELLSKVMRGENVERARLMRDDPPLECLPDMRRFTELDRNNPRSVGLGVSWECMVQMTANPQGASEKGFRLGALPERSQRFVRDNMARLEELSHSAHKSDAVDALQALAIIQGGLLREFDKSAANARRALALDSERESIWETRIGALVVLEDYGALLEACEGRVKKKDTTRNRVLFAKALFLNKQFAKAEQQANAALKIDPSDFYANLCMAALILKRAKDSSTVYEAEQYFGRAERQMAKLLDDRSSARQVLVDFYLGRAIYLGLIDRVDDARKMARQVLEWDKNNAAAPQVLSALNF
jgi:tetratricopeptide (TPR) repeat protein